MKTVSMIDFPAQCLPGFFRARVMRPVHSLPRRNKLVRAHPDPDETPARGRLKDLEILLSIAGRHRHHAGDHDLRPGRRRPPGRFKNAINKFP